MNKDKYRYSTHRLLVSEWHSIAPGEWNAKELEEIVLEILMPSVTRSLPPAWQGTYSPERANNWIKQRDAEGITLMVIEKSTLSAIGLVILFTDSSGRNLRLGYLLAESVWGKGYASELIQGFVRWCANNNIASVTGGVDAENIASRRVLEKNGFIREAEPSEGDEQMFVWKAGIENEE